MIVPYFNVLVLPHRNNTLSLTSSDRDLLSRYFNNYFSTFPPEHQLSIRIDINSQKIPKLKAQTSQVIESIIGSKEIGLVKINQSYTRRKDVQLMYQGLKNIEVVQSGAKKIPARLEHLDTLKQYFWNYKNQTQMKEFLKSLLIQQISYERKTIKYRSADEIRDIISVMSSNLKGEITFQTQSEASQTQMYIYLVDQSSSYMGCISRLVSHLKERYHVLEDFNKEITEEITMHKLVSQAKENVRKISIKCYEMNIKKSMFSRQLSKVINFISIFKAIIKEGQRLVKQEEELKRSFLEFVQQLTKKSSTVIFTYFRGLQSQIQFKQQKQRYLTKIAKEKTIANYLHTFTTLLKYKKIEYQWKNRQCKKIQNSISSFLIMQRAKTGYITSYLYDKETQKLIYNQWYEKLKLYFNKAELRKLKEHNKFKYGFSCCTQILAIKNHANYSELDPSNLLQLFEQTNKSKELITKIVCTKDGCQMRTIEGKCLTLGPKGCQKYGLWSYKIVTDKENQGFSSNRSSGNLGKISSFSTRKNQTQLSSSRNSLSGYNSVKNLTFANAQPHKIRQKDQYFKFGNSEFKVDSQGKIFGRGCNDAGQLGLGYNNYIEQFVALLVDQKVKKVQSIQKHSIVLTQTNQIYHFGKSKGILPQTLTPQLYQLSIGVIIDLVCSIDDTFLLTEHKKIYSIIKQDFIRIPKEICLNFQHLNLVRTGTHNLQIVYLVAHWTNTLDKIQKTQINKYLTKEATQESHQDQQSMLVEESDQNQFLEVYPRRNVGITELSAILEESQLF